jgi:hypothetical protein
MLKRIIEYGVFEADTRTEFKSGQVLNFVHGHEVADHLAT